MFVSTPLAKRLVETSDFIWDPETQWLLKGYDQAAEKERNKKRKGADVIYWSYTSSVNKNRSARYQKIASNDEIQPGVLAAVSTFLEHFSGHL